MSRAGSSSFFGDCIVPFSMGFFFLFLSNKRPHGAGINTRFLEVKWEFKMEASIQNHALALRG